MERKVAGILDYIDVFAELANRLINLAIRFANIALFAVISAAPLAGADAKGLFVFLSKVLAAVVIGCHSGILE